MSNENENIKLVPELRFLEFEKDGEWNQSVLGSVAEFSKGKGVSKKDIVPDGKFPCIRYGELYTDYDEVISEVVSKTNVPKEELIFSKGNEVIIPSSGETRIDIARASCVLQERIALGGDLNIIQSKINGVFLSYLLNGSKKREIAKMAQGVSVMHLYNSQLVNLNIEIPKPREQQKIAATLTSLDHVIAAENEKLEALQAHKKGLLQQLFPAKGEKVPKLRFGEFSEEWEEVKLEDCLDYLQPTLFLVKSTDYNDQYTIPVLTAGKTFILGYTNEKDGIFKEKLPTIIFDDFTTASKYVDFPFKAKSSAMKMLIAKNNTNIRFIYEAMRTLNFEVSTHKRHWISVYSKLKLLIPKPEEQEKIANCLSSLDHLTTKLNERIVALKEHKKGLMQQMFPIV